jgi:hypothetical protein
MRKRITLLIAALTLALTMAFGSVAAFAASPAEEACNDAGGTYTKTGSQAECVILSNPGTDNENAATPKKDTNTQTGAGGGGGEKRSSDTVMGVGRQ